jgi:hypothetical protein
MILLSVINIISILFICGPTKSIIYNSFLKLKVTYFNYGQVCIHYVTDGYVKTSNPSGTKKFVVQLTHVAPPLYIRVSPKIRNDNLP